MTKIFGLSFIFFYDANLVIHQMGALQIAGGNKKDEVFLAFIQLHNHMFRSFGHEALHGFFHFYSFQFL